MNEKFDFTLIDKFKGYNSASDKTKLPPGTLIRGSKNVIKKLSGTIASREGIKRRGSVDTTDAGVKSEYVWETSLGTTRHLRVCNGKLQVESDIVDSGTYVWYDLLETSTLAHPASTLTRFVFDTWWDNEELKDRLVMVRGDDSILHWSGGMALIDSVEEGDTIPSGSVTIIDSIIASGTNYVVDDVLTIDGGNGDATVTVTSVSGGGSILALEITTAGSGYSSGLYNLTGGSGSSGAVSITATTSETKYYNLTKQGSETWAEAGFAFVVGNERKIIINGVEYSYADGIDSTVMRVISGDVPSISSGDVAIQSVIVSSDKPIENFKADFIKVIANQAWVGSYRSRVVYISGDITVDESLGFLRFTNGGTLVYGDADALILDTFAKGIGATSDGLVIIFGGSSDLYVVTPNYYLPTLQTGATTLTGGTGRSVIQKIDKIKLASNNAAQGHEFIDNLNGYTVWLDQNNQLRALGSFANLSQVVPAHLSLPVENELAEDDFTGGHLKVVGSKVHITAPNNARDWIYEVREGLNESGQVISERLWQPPQIRGISRISVINGITFGHSNVNPQIYQLEDTNQWFDDHPSEEEIPYEAVARFSYIRDDKKISRLYFDAVYFEGYFREGFELKSNIYFEYQGAAGTRELVISDDTNLANFYSGFNNISFGQSAFGTLPLGDGIIDESNDQDLIPKVRSIMNVPRPINCFEFSIEIYGNTTDNRFEILELGTNIKSAKELSTFLRKSSS